MFELAFYWSLSFSQFFDVKRKDFVEMFIHHLTTIALLSFSWTCNLTRLIDKMLCLNDIKLQVWDFGFGCARFLWHLPWACQDVSLCQTQHALWYHFWYFCSRLDLHSTWAFSNMDPLQVWCQFFCERISNAYCEFSATIEAPQMVEMFPAYYIFNGLLSVLLVLHVIWTYFILKIAFHALLAKKVNVFQMILTRITEN